MKKAKIIQRKVREELFGASVYLVMSEWNDLLSAAKIMMDEEKFEELKGVVEKGDEDSYRVACNIAIGGGSSVIWTHPSSSISELLHEIVHATAILLRDRGVPLSRDTEEVYAYMVEFLFKGLTTK